MFKKIFIDLCNKKGEAPSAVCRKVGITPATFSGWSEKTIPRQATLYRIADYFGVTVDYLLSDNTENAPTPTRSECEEKILEHFRGLSSEEQDAFLKVIEAMSKSRGK